MKYFKNIIFIFFTTGSLLFPIEYVPDFTLSETVIIGTRNYKENFELPQSVEVIYESDLQEKKLFRSIPESLKESGGILVQKTGNGQGSPFIRGFTGFRNLFLIDGIRLNNSIFRDGPNQYWNTVDVLSFSRIELSKGPSSVIYGSDAIGGALQVLTKDTDYDNEKDKLSGSAFSRYSSAENSNINRFDIVSGLGKNTSILLGSTLKNFGDLEAGSSTGKQPYTGYDEFSFDAKLIHYLDVNQKITLLHQNFNQNDAWRTHKTIHGKSFHGTSVGNELKRILHQNRKLTYLKYESENIASLIDQTKFNISFHEQDELRDRERIKSNNLRKDIQGFSVDTIGVLFQVDKFTKKGLFSFGVDFYQDKVNSFKREFDLTANTEKGPFIQGPVGDDASFETLGIYAQNDIDINKRFSLITGIRWDQSKLEAERVEDPTSGKQIRLENKDNALLGNIKLSYFPQNNIIVYLGVSQSFRSPNLSDLTRLDTARSNEIETPVPNGLSSEKFLTYDLGIKSKFKSSKILVNWYYTDISNLIIRTPTGRVIGTDIEVTKKNSGDGYVTGFDLGIETSFTKNWSFSAKTSWQDGEIDTFPTSSAVKERDQMSRLLPITSLLSLKYQKPNKKWWIETFLTIADNQNKLSKRDKSDTQRIPPNGTPSYEVLTIRGGKSFGDHFISTVSIENVADKNYRVHGSGLNESGRNFIIGLKAKF